MPKLSDLLTSAAAVRNESAAEQNTALRVGNVLYSLTQYLQQYTSVADITMKVSAVGVTITAKSQTGDNTLFDKTIALPVASSEQAGILTAEAFSAFLSDISELQEDLTALFNEKDVLSERVKVNSENIADLGLELRGKSTKSSAYYGPFISMGDIAGWPAFTEKLDDISKMENKQKYMGRCRARVDGITVEVYHFINSFSKSDFSQVVIGNVSANQNEHGKWQVTFTPNKFNIIYRQYKETKWSAWQRINDHPIATPSLDGLMSADDKKALDSVDSAFKNLEAMHFEEASEYCATFDNIIEKIEGGAIRFSKPTIFTFSGGGSGQGMIINLPSSGGLITQFAFLKATANGGFSRRIIQYNPSNFTITNVGEWRPISDLIPAATTSAAGLMSADDKKKVDNYPSNFVLDLGLVASQEAGEQEAAKSEVAGNRNISFIRFQVQGVRTLKTSLIMQWPNGVDETAQLMCVDKAQWRRNVTGATGVKGDQTTADPFERTAPHLIGYDKSRRMLQLKDYFRKVVPNENEGGVELPLATSTQDGLMSAEDKTKLNQTKPVEEVTWTEQHSMNAYTECGEYHIHGERKNKYDGLPIINADHGHTIDATLTVLDSSLPKEGAKNYVCVTQILRMSNRTGGDGHIFIRTGQADKKSKLASGSSTYWGTWEKLMGIFEKNGIKSVNDLDACTTNGMYSGLYTNTEQASLGGINFYPGDTFLMITANGYAASPFGTPQLTQILFKFPVRKAPLPATANMYIRVAYWDTSDANNKRWVFGNFAKMVTAPELAALESRIAALEAKLK